MTENEKARELIATSETTVKVDPQNGWYLKRFAALQFEGSVDNFSTNMPIHVLEQQLPKDDTMKLDDAVIEGQDFDYSKFYDERGNEYSSVSELVQTLLDLDDDDSIQEYNEENPDLPYIPYEKLREMDKKDIPELLLSVADEADYVDAYKEVSDIESWNVEVTPMSNNYETMGFAFTHQGLKEYEKSIDNHIFHFCRTDDMVATYPYPFSCDDGANTLLEAKDTDILTPVECLFLWTEYKNPNPIETKKK